MNNHIIMSLMFILTVTLLYPAWAGDDTEFYDPIERNIEGWTVAVDPRLLHGERADLGTEALQA